MTAVEKEPPGKREEKGLLQRTMTAAGGFLEKGKKSAGRKRRAVRKRGRLGFFG